MADVINAAQRKGQLDNQTMLAQSQLFNGALDKIDSIGQSLYARKLQMAQALASAKMFAGSPEGQQMLAPTTTQTTTQAPVMRNQTAAYDPTAGTVTPNADMSGVATMAPPKTTTTSTPSPIDMGTLQTSMMGESPSNMLTQLFNRQKERQQFALDTQKQAFTEKMDPLKLAQQAALTSAITGVRGREVSVQEQNNLRASIAAEQARQEQARKDFPELPGTFISGILPEGSNEKEKAARDTYASAQKNIENYNRQLYGFQPFAAYEYGGPFGHY